MCVPVFGASCVSHEVPLWIVLKPPSVDWHPIELWWHDIGRRKKKEKRQGQTGCRRIKMECQFVTLPLCALLLSFLNLFSFPFFFFNSLFQGSSFLLSLFGSVLCVSHSALWFCIFLLKKKNNNTYSGFFLYIISKYPVVVVFEEFSSITAFNTPQTFAERRLRVVVMVVVTFFFFSCFVLF